MRGGLGLAGGFLLLGAAIVAILLVGGKTASAAAGAQAAVNSTLGGTPGGPVSTAGGWLADIRQAAAKWGVPVPIMVGVMGMETSFGANITTSSADAIGGFQFIPATAAQYGYPQTNTPDPQQQAQQADSAAHYLSDLYRQTGSWDTALRRYSGGGYGLSEVQGQAAQAPAAF